MKILIVSDTTKANYKVVKEKLKDHDVMYTNKTDYKVKIRDYEYIIAGRESYSSSILRKAKKLKIISRCGHGTDSIDRKYCKKNNIKVLDARGALDDTMADVTIGYMIMALRRLREIDEGTRTKGWMPILGNNLTGKTVGIIGLGGIGTAVAKRLQGFRTETIFYDTDKTKQHDYDFAKFIKRDKLLETSDIITLHCDLNEESINMINNKSITLMKKSPLIINTARGKMVDIDTLPVALHKGRISYCVLDVYPEEPLPKNSILRVLPNMLLGSHSTCYSTEGQRALTVKVVDNLLKTIVSGG